MRFLLAFIAFGLLSSAANAQVEVGKITCPEQTRQQIFSIIGPNKTIIEKMKKEISEDTKSPKTTMKLFDNSLKFDDTTYKKINAHEFENEETIQDSDDDLGLGKYTGTSKSTMIFVETGTRGVYVIKFNGSGKITSDKQGEYEVTIEYKMFDCKIEYLCK